MPDLDANHARADKTARSLRVRASQPRIDNGTAKLLNDSADTLLAQFAEIERLREALERVSAMTALRRGESEKVYRVVRAALAAQESSD